MLVDEARVAELGRIKLVRVRMELDPRSDQALPPLGHLVDRFYALARLDRAVPTGVAIVERGRPLQARAAS